MEKRKTFERGRFSVEVLQEASQELLRRVGPIGEKKIRYGLEVEVDDAQWKHNSLEEFFADYRRSSGQVSYSIDVEYDHSLTLWHFPNRIFDSIVTVKAPERNTIEAIFSIFEKHLDDSRIPEEPLPPTPPPEKPTVFVGHGRSLAWRNLKDHLQDLHNYNVVAYEVGARAGHEIRDVLVAMLNESSFAILVMTGEDETIENEFHPRLNVVHELGLFQGRLGFSRSIVLLEEGTQIFSNIHGVEQIRFSQGRIRETFGDVLATLHREFPIHAG